MTTNTKLQPLRDEATISFIESNTNFEYSIGDGESIGGGFSTLDLDRPFYIDMADGFYSIQDLNDDRTEKLLDAYMNNTIGFDDYHDQLHDIYKEFQYTSLEDLIMGLNELEKKYKKWLKIIFLIQIFWLY